MQLQLQGGPGGYITGASRVARKDERSVWGCGNYHFCTTQVFRKQPTQQLQGEKHKNNTSEQHMHFKPKLMGVSTTILPPPVKRANDNYKVRQSSQWTRRPEQVTIGAGWGMGREGAVSRDRDVDEGVVVGRGEVGGDCDTDDWGVHLDEQPLVNQQTRSPVYHSHPGWNISLFSW